MKSGVQRWGAVVPVRGGRREARKITGTPPPGFRGVGKFRIFGIFSTPNRVNIQKMSIFGGSGPPDPPGPPGFGGGSPRNLGKIPAPNVRQIFGFLQNTGPPPGDPPRGGVFAPPGDPPGPPDFGKKIAWGHLN